jgi:ribosomal protein S18 acetylase RimI-like enzyme
MVADASYETAAADGIVEYWRAACRFIPGAVFDEGGGLVLCRTGITAAPWYNHVFRADLSARETDRRIDETVEAYAVRGLQFLWTVGEGARPPDLAARLEARGLTSQGELVGMALDLDRLPETPLPEGVSLVEVDDTSSLEAWTEAYVNGFEMEAQAARPLVEMFSRAGFAKDAPFHHYVAMRGDHPVASSTLFRGEHAGGVWHVATLPAERNRGIGSAMTAAPLATARNEGYRLGVLHAAPMGVSVYQRLGFHRTGAVSEYLWSGQA